MTHPRDSARSLLADLLRGRRWRLVGIAASSLVSGAAEALFLVAVTRIAFAATDDEDRVRAIAGSSVSMSTALLVALGLVAVRMIFAFLSTWQSVELSVRVVADLRLRVATAFLRSSWEVQQDQEGGSLQQYLLTYAGASGNVLGGFGQGLITAANLTAMLVIAIVVDPAGAVVLVAAVAVLGLLLRPLRSAVRRRSRAAAEASMEFAVSVNEASQMGLELHVFHVQDRAEQRVNDLVELNRIRSLSQGLASGMTAPIYTGLAYVALLGALATVSAMSTSNLDELGAVMLIMLRSLGYGQALQINYMRVISSLPPLQDLYAKLAVFDQGRRPDGQEPVGNVAALEVKDLTFSYTRGLPVLRDVTFALRPREIVGIVGPSGGGKSTLVELLLGLRDPDHGEISADGRDIRSLRKTEWARRVTFVPQEARLITGTITDNIRFLREDVSDDTVRRAAELAQLHADIEAFPDGYGRMLGADGARLSGGQRQRLCIARALVERPDVLILDEPTSALDVRSEYLIRETILALKDRMTVVVIAHRLSTLDICDRIMVIQEGLLKGFDTPTNLEVSSDFYREALLLSGLR